MHLAGRVHVGAETSSRRMMSGGLRAACKVAKRESLLVEDTTTDLQIDTISAFDWTH